MKEARQAALRALAPFSEAAAAARQQSALWLGVGGLSALGSVAGGMGGFVSAAGNMGGIGRLSEIGALGAGSAELLRALRAPGAYLETESEMARERLRALADFGTLERLRSFAPDIAAPRPAPNRRAPAAPHAPEPPAAEIAEVHLPSERWAEVLTVAIREGKATKAEVQRLLMSMPDQPAPGIKPPLWEEIEVVALLYKEHGHRYDNQECFVRYCLAPKGMAMAVQTFQRWLKQYETATGEQIRPGRGSRKRKVPSRGM